MTAFERPPKAAFLGLTRLSASASSARQNFASPGSLASWVNACARVIGPMGPRRRHSNASRTSAGCSSRSRSRSSATATRLVRRSRRACESSRFRGFSSMSRRGRLFRRLRTSTTACGRDRTDARISSSSSRVRFRNASGGGNAAGFETLTGQLATATLSSLFHDTSSTNGTGRAVQSILCVPAPALSEALKTDGPSGMRIAQTAGRPCARTIRRDGLTPGTNIAS